MLHRPCCIQMKSLHSTIECICCGVTSCLVTSISEMFCGSGCLKIIWYMNFYSDFTEAQSIRAHSFSFLNTCSVNKVNEVFTQTFVILFEGSDQKLERVRS